MENDDFVAPIYILMIACHTICNNQHGYNEEEKLVLTMH